MPTVPIPNVVEAEIRGTFNGEPMENTLLFEIAAGVTAGAINALAPAIENWWFTSMLPRLSNQYVLKEVHCRDVSPGATLQATSNTHMGAVGADTGSPTPSNVAWVVKFLTGLAGRSYRGRNYIGGFGDASVIGNVFTSVGAALIVGAYQNLLGGGTVLPAGWQWVVGSRFHAGAPRAVGIATPVNAVSFTDLIVDSQRNRLH